MPGSALTRASRVTKSRRRVSRQNPQLKKANAPMENIPERKNSIVKIRAWAASEAQRAARIDAGPGRKSAAKRAENDAMGRAMAARSRRKDREIQKIDRKAARIQRKMAEE